MPLLPCGESRPEGSSVDRAHGRATPASCGGTARMRNRLRSWVAESVHDIIETFVLLLAGVVVAGVLVLQLVLDLLTSVDDRER